MTGALKDQTVLVVGRGSGLARAVVLAALDAEPASSRPAVTRSGWTPPTRARPGSAPSAST